MKANWKERYSRQEDIRVGQEMDRLIELGIRMACIAFNETEGIGAVKIERARQKIDEYIDREFKGGAERFTESRRHNLIRGIDRMNAAYEAIMSRNRKSAPSVGADEGTKEKNPIEKLTQKRSDVK